MKTLLLTPDLLSTGGIQRYNRLLVSGLDRYLSTMGGELHVLALNDHPPFEHDDMMGTKVTRFHGYSANRVRFMADFGRTVRQVDWVIYGLVGFAPLVFVQRLLSPSSQNTLLLYGIEAWSYRSWVHANSVRAIQQFISISAYTLDSFTRAYAISPEKRSVVLPNPVSPQLLSSDSGRVDTLPPTTPSFRILSVSRLAKTEQRKGIDTVIQALPSLAADFPLLKYVIVGVGADRLRLESLARQLGVESQVEFRGYVPDEQLADEFRKCDIYVMPSEKEGFGFVFIEAMAYGKPVIGALAGAVPEVVEDGKTGLLVEYGNIPQLIEALRRLLTDDQLRLQMGRAGQQTVWEKYTFAIFSSRLTAICEEANATVKK